MRRKRRNGFETCDSCGREVLARSLECPHCGFVLIDDDDLIEVLEQEHAVEAWIRLSNLVEAQNC